MIKDVMVSADGSLADDVRLEVAGTIAQRFQSQVVALVLNSISLPTPIGEGLDGGVAETALLEKARAVGDLTEERLVRRLKLLDRPVEIRRFDVLADDTRISPSARLALRIHSSRYGPTARWIPSVSSRPFSSDRVGICFCSRRQNDQKSHSIASYWLPRV